MFVPLFRRHTVLIKRAFHDVSSEEMEQLEVVLKKIGRCAESLAEKKDLSLAWISERKEKEHCRGRKTPAC